MLPEVLHYRRESGWPSGLTRIGLPGYVWRCVYGKEVVYESGTGPGGERGRVEKHAAAPLKCTSQAESARWT